jgi:PAS domain S-box-containing protein
VVVYVLLPLVAAAVCLGMLNFAWQQRTATGAYPLIGALTVAAGWSAAQSFKLASTSRAATLFWDNVQLMSVSLAALFSLVFALHYTGRDAWLSRRLWLLLAVEPALDILLIWTDPWHSLLRESYRLDTSGSYSYITSDYGWWGQLSGVYIWLALGVAVLLVAAHFARAARYYRLQTGAVLLGVLVPCLVGVSSVISPASHLAWGAVMALTFAASSVIMGWAVLRHHLLDLSPVARDHVIEHLADGVIVLDSDQRVRDLNPAAQRITRAPPARAIGLPITDLLPDVVRLDTGVAFENGTSAYELLRLPLHDPHTPHPGHVIILHDITERLKTEHELKRRNQELALLNRVIGAATSTMEINDVLTVACRELALAFSVPQAATALLTPDRSHFEVVAEYLGEGQSVSALGVQFPIQDNPVLDYINAHKSPLSVKDVLNEPVLAYNEESRRNIEARGTVSMLILPLIVRDEIIGTIGLDSIEPRDFTPAEIRLAASVAAALSQALHNTRLYADLRASETRYRALFEQARDAIFIETGDEQIVDANPAASRLLGYTRAEFLSKRTADLLFPGTYRGSMIQDGHVERVVVHKNGANIPVDVVVTPLSQDPEPLFLSIVRDITERKRAEADRERLIDELRAFASTVAHDLKNPLSAVMAYAALLSEEHAASLDATGRDMLDEIANNSQSMNRIIDELLLLASVRESEAVEFVPLDMAAIVVTVLDRLEYLIRESQAVIIQPDSAWPLARGHIAWVQEVWVNYISNAIKYGGQPPRVELGAAAVPGGMVRFWVRDNGPGIAPADQDRLFIPFTRLEWARGTGHGLGLSIVKRIVDRLGGQVGVESAPGQGSTFWFTLPEDADV